jgi:hypothetical protein
VPAYDLPDLDISEEKEKEIARWLEDQLTNALLARESLVDLWLEIQEWYEKTELEEKKDYPFEGAAHLMVALMPTFIEQIKAKIHNTIWAPSEPFTAKIRNKDFAELIKPVRSFMTWSAEEELDLQEVYDSLLLEYLKLGSGVTKTIYTVIDEPAFLWVEGDTPNEGEWVEYTERTKDQPEVLHVPLDDILWPIEARSFETAEWKAHRVRLSWPEIQHRAARGDFVDIERLEAWEEKQRTDYEEERQDQASVQPVEMTEYELWEVWFRHPLKEDGLAVKQVWWFHLDSTLVFRKQYNWYPKQMDPFDILTYETREHRILGNGVGQMVLSVQKEVSTMHNQRLDSATVVNAPVFKRRADALGSEDIIFRPGGSIPVEEMDDIEPLFTGVRLDSTVEAEQHTLALLQQRIGMQDFTSQQALGNAQSTAVLAIMAESTRRFDGTIRKVRKHASSVMTKVLLLYQKYSPKGKAMMVLGEDGELVEAFLAFPEKWITDGISISVTATTSTTSKELERQNKLSLFGLVTQYYGQLTQYVLQANNPQLPEPVRMVLLRIVDGLTTLVEDILEDFDLRNAEELAIPFGDIQQGVAGIRSLIGTPGDTANAGLVGLPGAAGGLPAQAGQQAQNGPVG